MRRDFTMYAIQKSIEEKFAPYTTPSFGALKPALRRLEANGFITSHKSMSDGGKLSIYYGITPSGEKELIKLILEPLSNNPLQFLSNAKVKLSCAGLLNSEEKASLFLHLKTLAATFKQSAENILNDSYSEKDFYQNILLDNTIVEYNGLINLIESFEKDNVRDSK